MNRLSICLIGLVLGLSSVMALAIQNTMKLTITNQTGNTLKNIKAATYKNSALVSSFPLASELTDQSTMLPAFVAINDPADCVGLIADSSTSTGHHYCGCLYYDNASNETTLAYTMTIKSETSCDIGGPYPVN